MTRTATFALAGLLWSVRTSPQVLTNGVCPPVTQPPAEFFARIRQGDRDPARQFYRKYLEVDGIPVGSAAEVADQALQRTYDLVTHLLAGRPDIKATMVKNGMYLIIIGKDQVYTDMPEYSHHPNPEYQNERVRGTGGLPTSFGEENLLCLPIDRYDDESIGLHEFCHTVDSTLRSMDSSWTERRNTVYRHAIDNGLWKNTYAESNPGEYWSETCQCYFNCARINNWNHGPIATREQLRLYDPEVHELIRTTFNLGVEHDWHYTWLQKLPNVIPPPAKFKIDPFYTKLTWAREFTVLGRQANDRALLKANDTIRKMFAFRHDILKALIADGVKLVVLGRNERLADLPEYNLLRQSHSFDPLARSFSYGPGTKLLAVSEENLLEGPEEPMSGECQVVREFAKALFDVTATRPVDPNWNNRGRDVQQYELRVKRLDVQFGENVKQAYTAAMNKGLWKGTPAARDHVEYWAQGVVAYFNATGQGLPPNDAPHPITTRELLKEYDPDLYALVNETMAYDGHVDWRYSSRP
jgi:hypothetical protein